MKQCCGMIFTDSLLASVRHRSNYVAIGNKAIKLKFNPAGQFGITVIKNFLNLKPSENF